MPVLVFRRLMVLYFCFGTENVLLYVTNRDSKEKEEVFILKYLLNGFKKYYPSGIIILQNERAFPYFHVPGLGNSRSYRNSTTWSCDTHTNLIDLCKNFIPDGDP